MKENWLLEMEVVGFILHSARFHANLVRGWYGHAAIYMNGRDGLHLKMNDV